jgi:hypothetical protein
MDESEQFVFREKRKWQIALRRYVLEKQKVSFYARYFGLDIIHFRKWIELQFDQDLNWNNFGKAWQFEHIVPVVYFDFTNEDDLKLCWNFINIRVDKAHLNKNSASGVDVLTAKAYFENIFRTTGFPVCNAMINKIQLIENAQIKNISQVEAFIKQNSNYLATVGNLSAYEFEQLNMGVSLEEINMERTLLLKFT